MIQYAAEEVIAAGIDTLIFVTGRNKRAIEDHFDANYELESFLRASGKDAQADMIHNIILERIECIFVRQAVQMGLGYAVLCAERAVGSDHFAVLLADDFLTDYEPGVTTDLVQAFTSIGKSQLSVMNIDGPDISKYGVVVPNGSGAGIASLVEKPDATFAPSNLASIAPYVLTSDIFQTLRGISAGSGGEIQLAGAINLHAQQGSVEIVRLNGWRFDCGSLDGFMLVSEHEHKKRYKN